MKLKNLSILYLSVITILFTGLSVNRAQACAHNLQQLTEFEASEMFFRTQSRCTIADVIKGINDGKLSCTKVPASGYSILVGVLYKKDKELLQACITQCRKNGNRLDHIDYNHRTILHNAAMSSPEVLQMVLRDLPHSQFLINRADDENHTPIYLAAGAYNPDNTRILKEAGADVNIKQSGGITTLEYVQYWLQTATGESQKSLKQIEEILSNN